MKTPPRRTTIFERGQECASTIIKSSEYLRSVAAPEDIWGYLYTAWARGYNTGKRDGKKLGAK